MKWLGIVSTMPPVDQIASRAPSREIPYSWTGWTGDLLEPAWINPRTTPINQPYLPLGVENEIPRRDILVREGLIVELQF